MMASVGSLGSLVWIWEGALEVGVLRGGFAGCWAPGGDFWKWQQPEIREVRSH